ncbi:MULTISPECIES: DMT family transporter [Lactiplantibacillus]|uniref:DMT family transporter n=1 Tax=Lactiplantibacillus TaxID=2767842 RepID=UPI001C1F6A14|nr:MULTISPECIES: DMT family transporter [Lactiplantibacillus]MBU7448806.1 DMT family transporter [Lactiplantibacillus sp. 7.2.4]MBU7481271.1 DMT family transporter [Lactiplantibacillus pentosus]MDY1544565.1 DMT family transporter [Lactiplantibacillus pentosus]
MFLLALIPILMGGGLAMQTAVNAKLRQFVGSPYLASAVSFSVGALFLIVLTLLSGVSPFVSLTTIATNPWWIWLGGLLGVIGLTVNLLLFPRLGSIQTAVLPIFGQIVMGILIDQFGWFASPREPLTIVKVIGLVLVTLGMLVATVRFNHATAEYPVKWLWLWRLLGIGAGMLIATQAAINGHLGTILQSSVHAAMVSFTVGAVLLLLLIAVLRVPTKPLQIALQAGRSYWWMWIGGFLGAAYVFGSAWLVPQIGTGQVVVIALFGQLLFSAIIEQFGWFEAQAQRVKLLRLVGLLLMLVGVIGIHFL